MIHLILFSVELHSYEDLAGTAPVGIRISRKCHWNFVKFLLISCPYTQSQVFCISAPNVVALCYSILCTDLSLFLLPLDCHRLFPYDLYWFLLLHSEIILYIFRLWTDFPELNSWSLFLRLLTLFCTLQARNQSLDCLLSPNWAHNLNTSLLLLPDTASLSLLVCMLYLSIIHC